MFLFITCKLTAIKSRHLSRLSTIVLISLERSFLSCLSHVLFTTMACLSIIAQADGFQHASGDFFFKAMVLVDLRTGIYQLRRFESTDLLTHDRDHLMTYRIQSAQHGWHLNSAGLPQCAAETALLTFLQDALLNAFEVGHPVPTSVVLWTKGQDMLTRYSTLALALAPLYEGISMTKFNCLKRK